MTPPSITPTLTVCGCTGAGKSSLINALVHADVQAVGVTPTTQQRAEHQTELGGIPVYLLDTPGLGEAAKDADYEGLLRDLLPHSDMVLWVVGYDHRALDRDVELLHHVRTTMPDLPLLILATAVDRVSRDPLPETFDPFAGTTAQEQAVGDWLTYLQKTFAFAHPADLLPCAAGASHDDTAHQYNLAAVSSRIEALLPEATRLRWLAEEKASNKRDKVRKIILTATAMAGTIGLMPLPVADLPFIVTIQVALILSLCHLHGRAFSADAARSLSLAALSAVAGPLAFQALIKLVPGFGSLVGAGVAAACTYAVGTATQLLLEKNLALDLSTFKSAVVEAFNAYRKTHK